MPLGPTTITVPLTDRPYEIHVGCDGLKDLWTELDHRVPASQSMVITDQNVSRVLGEEMRCAATSHPRAWHWIEVPPGEPSKSIAQAERLWSSLAQREFDRQSRILALGGGVVGDLAGFVAATYMRGVPYVQIPTTLLAQVDSSVGGKVAINLPGSKNVVGCFWQPAWVLIDVGFLVTLPDREFRSGLAEVVKYGAALDGVLFEILERQTDLILRRDLPLLQEIVLRSCACKARIVASDERDLTGHRALLNYGHTVAHALEAQMGFGALLHGEAVAMGLHYEAKLAQRLGYVDETFVQRQADLLSKLGLSWKLPAVDPQALVRSMRRDKKTEYGRFRLVLPQRLGHATVVDDVPATEILSVLSEPDG